MSQKKPCQYSLAEFRLDVKNAKPQKKPRQYSLVRFRFDLVSPEDHIKYPFVQDGKYIFFGNIPNMGGGHCVVADQRTGQLFCGYHTENFTEIPEDEV